MGRKILIQLIKLVYHLSSVPFLRNQLIALAETRIRDELKKIPELPMFYNPSPRIAEDKFYVLRAMIHSGLRGKPSWKFVNTIVENAILSDYRIQKEREFRARYGVDPPGFLTISPGMRCNLRCVGCYANSADQSAKLDYDVFSWAIDGMKKEWGARFVTISGGEPLIYRSKGKTILDICRDHSDVLFLMYTNGTLITEEMAERIADVGNLTPAISVEGLREATEARRGKGTFDKIVSAMENLRKAGVIFGLSVTATKQNVEGIFTEEFNEFYFEKMNAAYAWIFHYMPIGRDIELDLMITPKQRYELWKRSWKIIRDEKRFVVDFWNHGTVSDGCISAGRAGGYLYIDWHGNVSPCVFFPYSPVNINDIYRRGGHINEIWDTPFFKAIREWQHDYVKRYGNWLRPCIIRDHHRTARKLIDEFKPKPIDEGAQEALTNVNYYRKMVEFDDELARITDPVWEEEYIKELKEKQAG
ncbi:radical SAM protein [candidate division WOR-3 bacterium]|uniref:Radical SAM protein n=1 Tax=candidate division WOR-3 bacterium TaxID=2052148 RepID=A0A660SDZ2_UNCW3|nr:MAG: radical SAM protein [candidate division WOR-3 bacterium]